jgi:hypothetical protein
MFCWALVGAALGDSASTKKVWIKTARYLDVHALTF